MVRALCAELDPWERIGTFETEYELHLHELTEKHRRIVAWESRPGSGEVGPDGRQAGEIPLDEDVYVICRSGGRSLKATEYLNQNGFDAINVKGGMGAWQDAEYPMVSENGQDPQVRAERLRAARVYGPERFAAHSVAIGSRPDRWDFPAKASCPVLIVGGPRFDESAAADLGVDRVFGRGTTPGEVASYLAHRLTTAKVAS